MLEKIGKVSNPLTIVAIFAAIVEVSASIVLPFISERNQGVYLWFLMGFPSILVILFFAILNWNHRVLYAPSDWKDEGNFFRPYDRVTREEREKRLRIDSSVGDSSRNSGLANGPNLPTSVGPDIPPGTGQAMQQLDPQYPGQQVEKYRLVAIENEVKTVLAVSYGQVAVEQAVFGANGNRYIFDAIIKGTEIDWFVEIKDFARSTDIYNASLNIFAQFERYNTAIAPNIQKKCGFILAIVLKNSTISQRKDVARKLLFVYEQLPFLVRVEIFDEDEILPS